MNVRTFFRVALVLPVALLAMLLMQLTLFPVFLQGFQLGFGYEVDWTRWAAKVIASPFMGGAFVIAAVWIAPVKKGLIFFLALLMVVIWGGVLIYGSFHDGIFEWTFFMGIAGILGGVIGYLLSYRLSQQA